MNKKHRQPKQSADNNKEFNQGNKDPRDNSVFVNVSQDDREKAEILVDVVKDAFAMLNKQTKVVDYKANLFNSNTQKFERNVRVLGVRPVDDEGNSTDFGVFDTEANWAASYKRLKADIPERKDAVQYIVKNARFRSLIQS